MYSFKDICSEIRLASPLFEKVNAFYENNRGSVSRLAEKCRESDFSVLRRKNDLTALAVCIEYARRFTYFDYLEKGIKSDIFFNTLYDITVWCENNNNKGLKNYRWLKNHLKCELFSLGRLQFQMFKCTNKTLDYFRLPFEYGDSLVYVHIPQGNRLDFDECKKALDYADRFFGKYFPEFKFSYYFCESWLLYEKNSDFMKSDCNILKFQTLFDIAYSVCDDSQALERIFGAKRFLKHKYPENTSLQRSAKQYILSSNKLGLGVATIKRQNYVI